MIEGIIQKILRKYYGDIYRDSYVQCLEQELISEIKKEFPECNYPLTSGHYQNLCDNCDSIQPMIRKLIGDTK